MLHKSPIGKGDENGSFQGSHSINDLRTNSQSFRHDMFTSALPSARDVHQSDLNIGTGMFADALITQLFHNLALLRVRVLEGAHVPLSQVEVTVAENGRETDRDRLASLEEILRLMKDQMAGKKKQMAAAAMSARSTRLMSSQSNLFDDEDNQEKPQEAVRRVVAEHVNNCFRYTMEEIGLRLAAHHESELSRVAPRARLDKAIAYQAEQLTKASSHATSTNNAMAVLRKKVDELQGTLQRREEYHKKQLDGFLREVCVLKEQLYRSYRDKDYIAKDVDLMQTVEDVDTGEDVSVDNLFQYRRQVRAADKLVMDAQSRLRRLEEELAEKDQQVSRELHRQRSKEAGVAAMKLEMGELNLRCLQQDETIRTLQHSLSVARGDYEPPTFSDAEAQTWSQEEDGVEHAKFKSANAQAARSLGKLELLKLLDAAALREEKLIADVTNSEVNWEKDKAEMGQVFEERLLVVERERDAAISERDEVITNSKNAMEISQKARLEVDSIRSLAINQAEALVGELIQSQRTSDALRVKSLAVTRAFLGLQVRFEAMKTRQGVSDYKRKANAFHFQRAQTAVDCAKEEIAAVRKQCTSQLEIAAKMIRDAKSAEAAMRSESISQEEEHRAGVAAIQERVSTMEKASRILLQDYERLRNEFVSRAAKASPLQSRVASASGSRRPASGKNAAPLPPLECTGPADVHLALDALIASGMPSPNASGAETSVGSAELVIKTLVLDLIALVGSTQKHSQASSQSTALKEAESWAKLRKLLSSHNRLQTALSEITSISRKAVPK